MASLKHQFEEEDFGKVNLDRVRRMKALVKTLYKEDIINKRRLFRPIKAKGIIMLLSLIAVGLLFFASLFNFNRFIDLNEKVMSAEGHIEANLQRRANLFSNLVNITLNQAAVEKEIFRHVAEVRPDWNKANEMLREIAQNPDAFALLSGGRAGRESVSSPPAFASVESSLTRLLAVVEQYPDLKSYATYQQLMDKLVEIENHIATRRSEYNDSAQEYNHAISLFPWYLLARATGFSRVEYFKAEKSVHRVPILTQETFERLLPLGSQE